MYDVQQYNCKLFHTVTGVFIILMSKQQHEEQID